MLVDHDSWQVSRWITNINLCFQSVLFPHKFREDHFQLSFIHHHNNLEPILVRSGSKHHLRTSLSVSSEAPKTNGSSSPASANKNNQTPSSSGFSSIGNSSCSSGSGSPPGENSKPFLVGMLIYVEILRQFRDGQCKQNR